MRKGRPMGALYFYQILLGGKRAVSSANSPAILHSAFILLHLKCAGVKLIVLSALVDESLMVTLFDDFTLLENNDILRVSYS